MTLAQFFALVELDTVTMSSEPPTPAAQQATAADWMALGTMRRS